MRLINLVVAAAILAAASLASGQTTATVDCTGASIGAFTLSTPDVVRPLSTQPPVLIQPAIGYQFAFNPYCTGSGLGASVIGNNQPLAGVLNGLFVGGQRVLFGSMRNPSGLVPVRLDYEVISTTVAGSAVSLTLDQQILAGGSVQAAIRNIQRPFGGIGLTVNSGGLVVNTWTPPAPTISEWHFDGDLLSVKESNLAGAAASGPSKLRYLDDPAFGPLLGGVGGETTYASPPTPTGVTQSQSAFGTTTFFGIPNIGSGGIVDTVYRTSPPQNSGAPSDTAKSRGLGLALWPNTRDFWPDERIGQWTFVWDILIPQSSWDAAKNNSATNSQCIPLLETSQNNNTSADAFVLVRGPERGIGYVGEAAPYAGAVGAVAILPNVWFRLAISNNLYGAMQSRIFVNGALIGVSGADWIYNACKSTDPRWGDNSALPPATNATVVPGATWNAWGQFPSPWAYSGSPGGTGTAAGAPTASTVGLFCDINGWGESVYVANMLFSDQAMSDAQIAALGAPNARGIYYLRPNPPPPCPADFNNDGTRNVADIFAFLSAWFAQSGQTGAGHSADFNNDNTVSVADIFAFLSAWFAGCP